MSSDAEGRSARQRWRAPVIGAVAGLSVAAAIVGPAALADSGGGAGGAAKAARPAQGIERRGAPVPNSAPHQFTDAIAQLVRAGTITAAQGRALDAQIETGSMDPDQMVARGVLSASQMAVVNDRLVAVKKSLAAQAPPQTPPPAGAAAAKAACGTGAGSPPGA